MNFKVAHFRTENRLQNDVYIRNEKKGVKWQPVSSATQFIALIRQTDPGSKITLKVTSGGDTHDVAVTLGETED